jgi:hypothetical protein
MYLVLGINTVKGDFWIIFRRTYLPSPLVGEGGERSEPGEGDLCEETIPLTRLAAIAARHPLPQGERVRRSARRETGPGFRFASSGLRTCFADKPTAPAFVAC